MNNVIQAVGLKAQKIPCVWTLHDEIMTSPTANLLSNITQYLQHDLQSRRPEVSIAFQWSDLDYSFEMSPLMLQHSLQIMKKHEIIANNFILFRVRRGDLKRICNSELGAMPRVL